MWNSELIVDPCRWLENAVRLLMAVRILDTYSAVAAHKLTSMDQDVPEPTPMDAQVMFIRIPNTMLMGFALECCLKGLLSMNEVPPKGHNLTELWKKVYRTSPNSTQSEQLQQLEVMLYLGRYPVHFPRRGEEVAPAAYVGSYQSFEDLIRQPLDDLTEVCGERRKSYAAKS